MREWANFMSERADFRPERADSRPERADFRPKRAWGGQTDGMTTENPPVFYKSKGRLILA